MEPIKIVARFLDGRVLKGYAQDFYPNKFLFHLHRPDANPQEEGIEVYLKDLKAIFFVRDFAGNPAYNERKEFSEKGQISGKKVEVTFSDGEMLVGTTMGYDPKRPGFFLFPADLQSNNLRVFAASQAIQKVRFL
jgi:hypothetical protein